MTELTPYTPLYPNHVGKALPTWVLAVRVTLVGTSGHTHGGVFAARGSLVLLDDSFAVANWHCGIPFHWRSRVVIIITHQTTEERWSYVVYTGRLLVIIHGQVNKKPQAN